MTVPARLAVGLTLGLLHIVSFLGGRASVRARAETKTQVTSSSSAEMNKKLSDMLQTVAKVRDDLARETQTETTSDCPGATPGKTRTVTVVREHIVHDGQTAAASTHAAETHAATTEHAAATSTVRIVDPPRLAQWSLGAFAGLGLDGGRHAGGEVSRRILGPLWLGAKVDGVARTAMLSARVEF